MSDFIPYKELTDEQKTRVNDADEWVREKAAKEGLGLDRLVEDPSDVVRTRVALQGYGLDKLVDAPESIVRVAVAKQGYGLDKLVADPNEDVRFLVARQGYGLDTLINDPDWSIRREVASHGYGLDKLIDDKSDLVRAEVANQGYGYEQLAYDKEPLVRFYLAGQGLALDKLVHDGVKSVQETAQEYLKNNNQTLEQWVAANPDKCVLPENQRQNRQIGNISLDPQGNVVLATYGEEALIYRGERAVQPFVVAHKYDPSSGEWAAGTYYSDVADAANDIKTHNPINRKQEQQAQTQPSQAKKPHTIADVGAKAKARAAKQGSDNTQQQQPTQKRRQSR